MTDLTMDAICARHPDRGSAGSCDRCGKSYCSDCRVEDVAAERLYCSLECRDSERAVQPDTQNDAALLEGYDHPIRIGARSWGKSLRAVTTALGPLAAGTAILTLLFGGFAGESGQEQNSPLLLTLIAVGLFGMALTGVVMSRLHTGYAGDNVYLVTLRRFVPWLLTWLLMIGITVVGYVLLVIPGIYFNMRLFWADEFVLAHRVNPLKALDESWQISRGEAGKTFLLEFAMGWILAGLVFALVFALVALYAAVSAVVPQVLLSDAVFAGLGMSALLLAYSLVHSMQLAMFYGLRARHAATAVLEKPKRIPRVLQWVSVPAAVAVAALLGFSAYVETGNSPSMRVLAGADIPDSQYRKLLEQHIVDADETIEYFYSEGLWSVLEGGSVLTDRRVIVYEQGESGAIDIYEMGFDDISSIELVQQGDALSFSIYKVLSWDEEAWLFLFLPHESGDDRTFVSAVEMKIPDRGAGSGKP